MTAFVVLMRILNNHLPFFIYISVFSFVCVCVCVCVHVYVVHEDTNLYNDMGMTQVLQGEGDL